MGSVSPMVKPILARNFSSATHSRPTTGMRPSISTSRFTSSVMEYTFATASPAQASITYAPTA